MRETRHLGRGVEDARVEREVRSERSLSTVTATRALAQRTIPSSVPIFGHSFGPVTVFPRFYFSFPTHR